MVSVKNIILALAIFILTLFVGIYGLSTLYGESPEYDKYCPSFLNNETSCVDEGGQWINYTEEVIQPSGERVTKQVIGPGSCNYDYTACQQEWDDAQKSYYKKIFLTALPFGIIIIAIGALIFGLESVGAGLMLGGVGIIVYGTGSYWRFTDDWVKFLLSLVGLVVLIWLAYYWNKRLKRK